MPKGNLKFKFLPEREIEEITRLSFRALVAPSLEQLDGLWVVCVYTGMEELCHWWESGDLNIFRLSL